MRGPRRRLTTPLALILGVMLLGVALGGVGSEPGRLEAGAPRGTRPTTEELRRSQGDPPRERIEFTLEALSANYQRKQGGAGAGLAHHFLNLICSASNPALHEGRCPDGPYPDWRWSGPFTLDVLYLTALDFRGPRAQDYRVIEGLLHPLLGSCGDGVVLCGGDLSLVGGVTYHFTTQLAPFFAIVIGTQVDDLLAETTGDAIEPVARYVRDLRREHAGLLDALRRGIGLLQARDEIGGVSASLGQLLPLIAADLREATIRRALAARLPESVAAAAYARSLAPGRR